MSPPDAAPAATVVIARRWDQLGGRLNAIVNAASVAEHYGAAFRFVWPRGADRAMHEPGLLFDQKFLDAHEISPEDLVGRPVVSEAELVAMVPTELGALLGTGEGGRLVEIDDPFAITCLQPGDEVAAGTRFRASFASMGWSRAAAAVIEQATSWQGGDDLSAVHVRAGDIVTGDWRHTLFYGKYMPVPFVDSAVTALADGGRKSVLVLSDNPVYVSWLQSRHPEVVTSADIMSGYDDLPEVLRALADLVLLSRCRTIVGPSASAFSQLAANLGSGTVTRADALLPPDRLAATLRSGIDDLEPKVTDSPWLAPLVARDIVWSLDVFGDGLPPLEQLALGLRAISLDPDYGAAHCRVAVLAALCGDWEASRRSAAAALRLGEAVTRHDDPLLEALVATAVVGCLAAVLEGPGVGRSSSDVSLPGPRRAVEQLEKTRPGEFNLPDILVGLHRLQAMSEGMSSVTATLRDMLDSDLVGRRARSVDMRRFRTPVPGTPPARFEVAERMVEWATVHLSQSIGSALLQSGPVMADIPSGSTRGNVDSIETSASGVVWMRGWVADLDPVAVLSAGGLAVAVDSASGGGAPATLRRPDVDAVFPNPVGLARGFGLPVPLDSADVSAAEANRSVFGYSSTGHATPFAPS